VRKMTDGAINDNTLLKAFSIIEKMPDVETVVSGLRDLLSVDHAVYHSSKLGVGPSDVPYIRLTYPASWIKRYLQMGYSDVDPIVREGFLRTVPFNWSEIAIESEAAASFFADALAHGIGPQGYSIPVVNKYGHRAVFSVSSSRSEQDWKRFLLVHRSIMIEIANRLHRRVVAEEVGEQTPHLTMREVECLRWLAQGKSSTEIAAILAISPHTARDYLKSARFKLDCVTSAQAASKAIKFGFLKL
jgi:LuxR family transcriptional regulator, quorum-sensing system regulator CinR